jgi:hypothetical protein
LNFFRRTLLFSLLLVCNAFKAPLWCSRDIQTARKATKVMPVFDVHGRWRMRDDEMMMIA